MIFTDAIFARFYERALASAGIETVRIQFTEVPYIPRCAQVRITTSLAP